VKTFGGPGFAGLFVRSNKRLSVNLRRCRKRADSVIIYHQKISRNYKLIYASL